MLDLRRLRLLRELHARGTIAAVADALQFTPSAVSQQLAVLEREAGCRCSSAPGRGVRLTDAALVLVGHAEALLERAELAEAELAAAAGAVAGRVRIASFQSAAVRVALPACRRSRARRPACAASSSRPSRSSRCPRSRSATSTWCWPTSGSTSRTRGRWRRRGGPAPRSRLRRPARRHPAARRHAHAVPLAELAGDTWTTGHPSTGWEEMTQRTCREFGGFDPDIRHRTNDSVTSLASSPTARP